MKNKLLKKDKSKKIEETKIKEISKNDKSKTFGLKDLFYLISFFLLAILHVFLMENFSLYEAIIDLIGEII